jgi:DNA modification methylase
MGVGADGALGGSGANLSADDVGRGGDSAAPQAGQLGASAGVVAPQVGQRLVSSGMARSTPLRSAVGRSMTDGRGRSVEVGGAAPALTPPGPRGTHGDVTPQLLHIGHQRTCDCPPPHLNCLTAKEWLKCQLGVWRFAYEGRDVRDKNVHPATFPIALSRRVIELFTHRGELVLDPFVGSGTTLVAARDCDRNAVGFDLRQQYVELCEERLAEGEKAGPGGGAAPAAPDTRQLAVHADARDIAEHLAPETVSLIWTSPPYANLLNRARKNKSRRQRDTEQLGRVEQYSQDPLDLGTLPLDDYTAEMGAIFAGLLSLLRPRAHCVVNVPDMWWEDQRITIHVSLIEELRRRGYELRNVIVWDRTNVVNRVGIFGWPSNYITMGVTFEYLLHFWRPT